MWLARSSITPQKAITPEIEFKNVFDKISNPPVHEKNKNQTVGKVFLF
tara:strand:- start:289 stop:432 length:144 start_codon:yes stop_codon:yes gene_type:complete